MPHSRVVGWLAGVALGAALATAGSALAVPASAPTVTVRLFIDLQDPPSREAWTAYRGALSSYGKGARLVVHHVPLARHAHARKAAVAALVAKGQDQQVEFIDTLLSHPVPNSGAISRAARAVGLDMDALTRVRSAGEASAEARAMETGRRAAVAFGVRVAPSALINGRGVRGVPPAAALKRALQRAHDACRRARSKDAQVDCELQGARQHAPRSVVALDALRAGRMSPAGGARDVRPAGSLGPRFRVEIQGSEPMLGPVDAPVTATWFTDLADARQRRELGHLLALVAAGGLRLVVVPLPRVDPAGAATGRRDSLRFALAAVALAGGMTRPERGRMIAAFGDRRLHDWAGVERLAVAHGTSAAKLARVVAAPATTVTLESYVRLAASVDARPGTLYLNGRRWSGTPSEPGLKPALQRSLAEFTSVVARRVPPRLVYGSLVAAGRRISAAERDLEPREADVDFSGVPNLGSSAGAKNALPVHLFVDFRGLASKATFHALARLRRDPKHPVQLHLISIASAAKPGVTPSGASFLVAHHKGKGLAAARKLFGMRDPNAWSALRKAMGRVGVGLATLRALADGEFARAGAATATRLKKRLEMDEEPVLYIDGRRYAGPIDEGRIIAAVAFAASQRAPTGATP